MYALYTSILIYVYSVVGGCVAVVGKTATVAEAAKALVASRLSSAAAVATAASTSPPSSSLQHTVVAEEEGRDWTFGFLLLELPRRPLSK